MILVQIVLFLFGVPIVLILIGVAWLWAGRKLLCMIFQGC